MCIAYQAGIFNAHQNAKGQLRLKQKKQETHLNYEEQSLCFVMTLQIAFL